MQCLIRAPRQEQEEQEEEGEAEERLEVCTNHTFLQTIMHASAPSGQRGLYHASVEQAHACTKLCVVYHRYFAGLQLMLKPAPNIRSQMLTMLMAVEGTFAVIPVQFL